MLPEAIVCDLDGTLTDLTHREPLAKAKKWDEFYSSCDKDILNQWCYRILEGMLHVNPQIHFFFISGRPGSSQSQTEEWLHRHLPIEMMLNSKLYLRPKRGMDTQEFKENTYREHIEGKHRVLFAIDDDLDIVNMWRENGLICLDCAGFRQDD